MKLVVALWLSTMLAGSALELVRRHLPGPRRVTVANDNAIPRPAA